MHRPITSEGVRATVNRKLRLRAVPALSAMSPSPMRNNTRSSTPHDRRAGILPLSPRIGIHFCCARGTDGNNMNVLEVGNRAGRHAIVIGAGVAGLVAARVLSDHFVRVTLMDRDSLPDAPMPRSWVPQGQHAHVLAHGGQATLERLFPGLFAGMCANGSVAVDLGAQMYWQHLGIVSTRARTG